MSGYDRDPAGPPGVIITSRDIYDALVRLTDTVNRLVDKGESHSGEIADHEIRLRTLERTRWPLPAVSILIAVGSLALAALPHIQR